MRATNPQTKRRKTSPIRSSEKVFEISKSKTQHNFSHQIEREQLSETMKLLQGAHQESSQKVEALTCERDRLAMQLEDCGGSEQVEQLKVKLIGNLTLKVEQNSFYLSFESSNYSTLGSLYYSVEFSSFCESVYANICRFCSDINISWQAEKLEPFAKLFAKISLVSILASSEILRLDYIVFLQTETYVFWSFVSRRPDIPSLGLTRI